MCDYETEIFYFQDTITALQALSEFGKRDTNRAIYNIRLTVRSTATDNFKQIIDMKKGNWTITKFVNVSLCL